MRDLKADLEICEAATKGPWYVVNPKDAAFMDIIAVATVPHVTSVDPTAPFNWKLYSRYEDCDKIVALFILQTPRLADIADQKWWENARFLAAAREGWPEAIRRALAAEAERDALKARLAEIEAEAAAMRSALEDVDAMHRSALGQANERGDNLTPVELFRRVKTALSSSAGRETAERLRLLEEVAEAARAFTENCTIIACFNDASPGVCYGTCPLRPLRAAVQKLKGGRNDAGTEA